MEKFEIFSKKNLGSVRVVINSVSGAPWFVAKDVCDCLGINNSRQACRGFLPDEKAGVILNDVRSDGKSQKRLFTVVSEAGLYMLIMRSRKPEAVAFQRWITKELLPKFRRYVGFENALNDSNLELDISSEDLWNEFISELEDINSLNEFMSVPDNYLNSEEEWGLLIDDSVTY